MSHNHQASFKGNLQRPSVQKSSYGKNAFVYMFTKTWNDIQKEMKGVMLNTFSLVKIKSLLLSSTWLRIKHCKISSCSNSFKNKAIGKTNCGCKYLN